MVRKECYKIEQFPLDMPYAGDWYLWCLFALHHDVGYMGEPMVNYRLHDLSLSTFYLNEGINANVADEINVRWRILRKAEAAGCDFIVQRCKHFIADDYAKRIHVNIDGKYRQGLCIEDCVQSLISHVKTKEEEKYFRARVFLGVADRYYWKHEFANALSFYKKAIRENPRMPEAWTKYAFLAMGRTGITLRSTTSHIMHDLLKQ